MSNVALEAYPQHHPELIAGVAIGYNCPRPREGVVSIFEVEADELAGVGKVVIDARTHGLLPRAPGDAGDQTRSEAITRKSVSF